MPFCPQCGTEHTADDGFCGVCGRRLTASTERPAAPPPRPSDPAEPARRSTPPMLLAGLLVAAVAAVVAIVLFATRADDPPAAVAETPDAEPTAGSAAAASSPAEPADTAAGLDIADEQMLVELAADIPAIDPDTTTNITAALAGLNIPGAAGDRDELRGVVGPPQAFDLTFETDPQNPAGPLLRIETWYYFNFGSAFVFVDGRLSNSFPLEGLGEIALLPLQYDPAGFTRSLTWEQAAGLIDDPGAGPVTDFDMADVGVELDVYAGAQILLMFDPDGLAAVSTFPLTPPDE